MPCRTDICKGACCRFLVFNFDKRLDDDIKNFLNLHGVQVVEVWATKFHRRILKTLIQVPVPCRQFDEVTCQCKIYEKRPNNCKNNETLKSPFLPAEICSVLTPSLCDLSRDDVQDLIASAGNKDNDKHTA